MVASGRDEIHGLCARDGIVARIMGQEACYVCCFRHFLGDRLVGWWVALDEARSIGLALAALQNHRFIASCASSFQHRWRVKDVFLQFALYRSSLGVSLKMFGCCIQRSVARALEAYNIIGVFVSYI